MKSKFIILAFTFHLFASSNLAQRQICPEFPCIISSSSSGEVASAAIDNFLVEAARTSERIFVIARFGKNDTIPQRNLDRLCEARNYALAILPKAREMVRSEGNFDSLTTIFAEGERVEGEGRLEFYVGSKLLLTRLIERNKAANLNCCEDYTPAKRKREQRKCKEWKQKGASNKSMDARRGSEHHKI